MFTVLDISHVLGVRTFYNIKNVHLLTARYAASDATDVITVNDNGVYNVHFYAWQSGAQVNVWCDTLDTCNIACYDYKSCEGVTLYCRGNCIVSCSESDSTLCPQYGDAATSFPMADILSECQPTPEPTTDPSMSCVLLCFVQGYSK